MLHAARPGRARTESAFRIGLSATSLASVKHHEIAKFTETHGVNLEWLLEGRGRVFRTDPIEIGPNMTGSEFAACYRGMRPEDQAVISRILRGMARKNGGA